MCWKQIFFLDMKTKRGKKMMDDEKKKEKGKEGSKKKNEEMRKPKKMSNWKIFRLRFQDPKV